MPFSPAAPQSLKHLPFFEVLATAPEDSLDARLATAGLLSLRMLDHWVLAGPAIVEPESVSVRSVRRAIMALPANEPVREALLTTVNTMQMLRQVDLVPVLPRVFAYAQLLERHYGAMALAADAYDSVIRLADIEFDAELVMDSYHRLSICQRKVGALDSAVKSSTALGKLAGRRKDRARALRAKLGLGMVATMRGELVSAATQFDAISDEAEKWELTPELAAAKHNRAVVSGRAGNPAEAATLAHAALKLSTDPVHRDAILGDLAAFLIQGEQFDSAIDALRILDLTGSTETTRLIARVNVIIAAARSGNRELFERTRSNVEHTALPIEARVNLLIESAKAFWCFGEPARAEREIAIARREAASHGLTRSLIEIDSIDPVALVAGKANRGPGVEAPEPASSLASDLRQMLAAVAG